MSDAFADIRRGARRNAAKTIRLVLGFVVLAAILAFVRVDLRQFRDTLLGLHARTVVELVACALLSRIIRAWKWSQLLHTQGIRISSWQALRLSLVSHFAGAWTPGQIGGDAYRVLALKQYGNSRGVFSTLLLERYAGLSAVCFFALLTLPVTLPYLYRQSPWLLALVVAAMILVVGVLPCVLSDRLQTLMGRCLPFLKGSELAGKLQRFHQTLLSYRQHPRTLIVVSIATLAEVMTYFVINYLAARALGLPVNLLFFLVAMPIVHLLLRIPISFQSIGIQEGCFVYALVQHGFTPEQGLAVSVVQRALEWILAIVPGGLLLWLTSGPTDDAIAAGPASASEGGAVRERRSASST